MSDSRDPASAGPDTPSFVFATCKSGWEKQVKEDAKKSPFGLRPAYMRPGLITFKCEAPPSPDFLLTSFFARLSGLSLGTFKSAAELAAKLSAGRGIGHGSSAAPFRLHVFPREVPENGLTAEDWARVDATRERLRAELAEAGALVADDTPPLHGDLVLDIILEDDHAAPFFAGWHRHGSRGHASPGAIPRAVLPPEAPSRAWLKLVQALAFAGWKEGPALEGRTAFELGCAPGGASYAMLQRGITVYGVDPGRVDERALHFTGPKGAALHHLHMLESEVRREMVPDQVDLIVSDLNLPPAVVTGMVEKFCRRLQPSALILTLKINNPAVLASLGECLGAIRKFAPTPIHVTQLPANRDEVCLVAGRLG